MQKHKPLTLLSNFSWTFAGNTVYVTCQWGMLALLAKLGTPEMVGQYALGLAVTAPVLMFTNLQLRSIQVSDMKREFCFGDYLGLRLIGGGVALLSILGIILITKYRWETSLVILILGVAKIAESISDIFFGLIQKHERMDLIARSLMIKGFLSLLMLSIGLSLTGSVWGGAMGVAIAWTLVLILYDIRNGVMILKSYPQTWEGTVIEELGAMALRPHWHVRSLRKLVWLALPMGFVMMLGSLNTSIPRYFIERYLGERELGIFSALAYLIVAGSMVVNALAESTFPRMSKYYATGNRSGFSTLLLKLVGIGGLLGITAILVALIAGREILTFAYRSDYAEYKDLFVWLMGSAAISFVSSFLGNAMTAARYFRIQIPLLLLVTTTSALISLWLIPIKGLQGAVIALIFSALVQFVFSLAVIFHSLYKLNDYAGE
ncbi:MAG TPA: oligosaccharide flippase family protein [Coleofasciculaceae cyanobacterium]